MEELDQTRLVYIAGPYAGISLHNSQGYHAIDHNIAVAREAAAWCAENGLYFFCPHLNSCHFEVITPEVQQEYWYALDFRILSHCDALLAVGDWYSSKGTRAEIEYCKQHDIPVYFYDSLADRERLLQIEMELI